MSAERYRRAKQMFLDVRETPPEARELALLSVGAEDPDLVAEVRSLLAFAELEPRSSSILGSPECTGRDRLEGRRLGQFVIRSLIGAGGMGRVYEAEQDFPKRTVALKLMRVALSSPQAFRRFEQEVQVLARLRHPGIATVFEAGTLEIGGEPVRYLSMEHVRGARPITRFADEASLSIADRLELMARVCDAIHHGHSSGVIHRDLKPDNILVSADGALRVIDFGIARTTDRDIAPTTSLTADGQILGTLQYMSPEQCDGTSEGVDAHSDVYSLGMVMYELVCGKLPYDVTNCSLPRAARRIRESRPIPPKAHRRTLRGGVDAIVMKALEKDPVRRYGSAEEMGLDLRRHLSGRRVLARTRGPIARLGAGLARPRVAMAVAGMMLVALAILVELIVPSHIRTIHQVRKLTYDFDKANAELGKVAVSERTIVAAAVRAVAADNANIGEILVFNWNGADWNSPQRLTGTDRMKIESIGPMVAISGDVIVAGGRANHLGQKVGNAYVFRRNADKKWILEAILAADEVGGTEEFGCAVSVSGDRILVGDWHCSGEQAKCGSAFLFEQRAGRWELAQRLESPDPRRDGEFGISVALSSTTAVVGEVPGAQGRAPGRTYVFERDLTGHWALTATLSDEGLEDPYDAFGYSVAIEADSIAVGAAAHSRSPTGTPLHGCGAVFVYGRDAATRAWALQQKLQSPAPVQSEFFGIAVSISREQIAVGVRSVGGADQGRVYVFHRGRHDWHPMAILLASDAHDADELGESAAICGDIVVAGSRQNNPESSPFSHAGAAYVFDLGRP